MTLYRIPTGKMCWSCLVLVVAVILAFIPTTESNAQYGRVVVSGCGHNYGYSHQKQIVKEVIVKEFVPVAVPTAYPLVAVPVYSYVNAPGYTPGATYGSVLQPQVAVQQATTQAAGAFDADKIAELVYQRLEKRLKLVPEVPGAGAQNGGISPGGISPGGISSGGISSGGISPGEAGGPPPIKSASKAESVAKAVALLRSKCASCHSGAADSGGNLSLFTDSRQLKQLPAETRIAVYDAIYEGRMPKNNGQAMSDQEVELVRLWMRQK